MADDQERELRPLHVMVSAQEMAVLEQFRNKRGFPSRKAAVRELIRVGMNAAQERPAESLEP
jgi:hypothetical protein